MFKEVFISSCLAVSKSVVVGGVGVLLIRRKILDKSALAVISKLVFNVLLPCMLFVRTGSSMSWANLVAWWTLPLLAFVNLSIGALLGLGLTRWFLTHLEDTAKPVVVVASALGNSGSLPFMLVETVCAPYGPLRDEVSCPNGMAYVSVYLLIINLSMWSIGYHYMTKGITVHKGGFQRVQTETVETDNKTVTSSEMGEEDIEQEAVADTNIPIVMSSKPIYIFQRFSGVWGGIKSMLKRLIKPPVAGVLLGCITGLIPPLHFALFNNQGSLKVFTDSVDSIGDGAIAISIMLLGASLADGPSTAASWMSKRVVTLIGIVRFILLPLFGLLFVTFLRFVDVLPPNDRLFQFVGVLEFCVPTAMNINLICQMTGHAEKEVGTLLFWQYLLSAVSITVWVMVFVSIFS